jgi:hypothetical protein
MKTKIISLIVLIAIAVVSCQKDEADKPVKMIDVSFGVELVEPSLLKDDFPPDCPVNAEGDLLVPNFAEIVIDGVTHYVEVFFVDGKYYTQAFKMAATNEDIPPLNPPYVVTKFVLWTDHPVTGTDPQIVMATPHVDSDYAEYVSLTVPFEVVVGGFEKQEIAIEVLCFLPSVYDKFGFIWFEITEIVVREFCFFGDICANDDPYVPSDFVGSAYDDDDVNTPIPVDMHAIYEIRVFRNNNPYPAVEENVFSNAADPTNPLCVQFPDLLRVYEEAPFQFELWVLVPPDFEYVQFATFDVVEDDEGDWSILYGVENALNEFNAVDFAIGTCSPFSTWKWKYDGTLIQP